MSREKEPTEAERPLLEELNRAAILRSESYRLYLKLFQQALDEGTSPAIIARYANITPQAANSTKNRLALNERDRGAPASIEDVLDRVDAGRSHRRRSRRAKG